MAPTKPLSVLAISDGVPGHETHTRGLLSALAYRADVNVDWVKTGLRAGAFRYPFKLLLNHTDAQAPDWLYGLSYTGGALPRDASPDLVISSGGATLCLNAALARRFDVPNIFAGTLRGLRSECFTLVLTPFRAPDVPENRNIVLEAPLSEIEPAGVTQAAQAYRAERGLGDAPLISALIGGDGGGYTFKAADWESLANGMDALAARTGKRWLLTTSRRTGARAEAILKAGIAPDLIADAVWYDEGDRRKVVRPYLGAGDLIVVTEDSMSMLGEAAAAGRPVWAVSPVGANPSDRNRMIVERLAERRRIRRIGVAGLPKITDGADGFDLLTDSPLERLAGRIASRLPDLF